MLKKLKAEEETETEVVVEGVVMVVETEKDEVVVVIDEDVMIADLEVTDDHLEEILETEVTEEVLIVQDPDALVTILDLVIQVQETEDLDVITLNLNQMNKTDQDQDVQNPILALQNLIDQDVQGVKLFC